MIKARAPSYSAGGSGPLQFFCPYSWTGGTDPCTASATASSRLVHVTSVQAFNGQATVYGTCVIGQYAVVTLSVTDATGATSSAQDTLHC